MLSFWREEESSLGKFNIASRVSDGKRIFAAPSSGLQRDFHAKPAKYIKRISRFASFCVRYV